MVQLTLLVKIVSQRKNGIQSSKFAVNPQIKTAKNALVLTNGIQLRKYAALLIVLPALSVFYPINGMQVQVNAVLPLILYAKNASFRKNGINRLVFAAMKMMKLALDVLPMEYGIQFKVSAVIKLTMSV